MLCTRRDWLEIGGASLLGLTWAEWLRAERAPRPGRRQRASACVVIFLWGGPGQQDLWDLKPAAPAEVRGEYRPIATSVPGTHISERLPYLARQADKYTIVRSLTHSDFEHGSAAYTALTGHPHPAPGTNTPARPEDFPTYGAVVGRLRPRTGEGDLPPAVVLGPVMHQGNRPPLAGQNAGFLGRGSDPFRIADDPSDPAFQVEALTSTTDMGRLDQRQALLHSLHGASPSPASGGVYPRRTADTVLAGMDSHYQRAFELLRSSRVRRGLDMTQEPSQTRDRYGWSRFGQTLLMARRLLEAGVPFLTINWERQNADQWDTHRANYPKLAQLLPPFDQGLAAFLEDLQQRGLLESTLVYCLGEFGRTPRLNADAGRDHWSQCYSVLLAGGGIPPGRVVGSSDRFAAYPAAEAMGPWDVAATIYHCLGIDPTGHIHDPLGRTWIISPGQVVPALL